MVFTAAAAGQNGTLTFTGSVNQRIALNISNDSIGTLAAGAKVSVKVGTTTVVAPVGVGTNGSFIEPVTLTAAGTYTIKVDPDGAYTGSLTVNLYTVPADASAAITAGGAGAIRHRDEHGARPEHEAHVHGRREPEGQHQDDQRLDRVEPDRGHHGHA